MEKKDCIVKTSVAPLYSKPTFKSELITQALIWEYLIILDKKNNWYKIKQWDNYISWIHNSYIVDSDIYIKKSKLHNYHNWCYLNKTILNKKNNLLLSFGSCMPVLKEKKNGLNEVLLPNAERIEINKKYLINNKKIIPIKDIVNYCYQLIGIPYLWGGKSSFGYDCSGFIQTLLRLNGVKFPRDCSEQIKYKKMKRIKPERSDIGSLIFFKEKNNISHIGMFLNQFEFIHSSGCVKINSINKKHKNFDIILFDKIYEIYKLK